MWPTHPPNETTFMGSWGQANCQWAWDKVGCEGQEDGLSHLEAVLGHPEVPVLGGREVQETKAILFIFAR